MLANELRIAAAVTILIGALVIALEETGVRPGDAVWFAQNTNPSGTGPQDSHAGGTHVPGATVGGEIDAQDHSRMDTRQLGFSAGDGMSRAGSVGAPVGPTDFDSRRDNSRLDSRQQRAPIEFPNARDEGR